MISYHDFVHVPRPDKSNLCPGTVQYVWKPCRNSDGVRACLSYLSSGCHNICYDAYFLYIPQYQGTRETLVSPRSNYMLYLHRCNVAIFLPPGFQGTFICLPAVFTLGYPLQDGGQIDGRPCGANVVDCWPLRPLPPFFAFMLINFLIHHTR